MADDAKGPSQEAVERITAAAIKIGPCVYTGPHHHTIIHYVSRCTGMKPVKGEQGFVTSEGRFVNRGQALGIAARARQVDPTRCGSGLMSENLWILPDDDENQAALRAVKQRTRLETLERAVLPMEVKAAQLRSAANSLVNDNEGAEGAVEEATMLEYRAAGVNDAIKLVRSEIASLQAREAPKPEPSGTDWDAECVARNEALRPQPEPDGIALAIKERRWCATHDTPMGHMGCECASCPVCPGAPPEEGR